MAILTTTNQGLNFTGGTTFIQTGTSNIMSMETGGNIGISVTSPNAKLDVDGVISTRTGTNSAYSIGVLEISDGGTPSQIKITTAISFGGTTNAHSVKISGFQYGSANTVDLQISWHVYNNSFYNRAITSSGGWAPTVTLAVENGYVVIHLSSPGYWPKMYVESLYNAYGSSAHAQGWSWADAAISGDSGKPVQTVSYKANFGNSFLMDSDGDVGIGETTPTSKLSIKGAQAAIDITRGTAGDSKWEFSSDSTAMYISEMSTGTRDYVMTLKETSGNVGIGTTSPGEKLEIDTAAQSAIMLRARYNANYYTDYGSNQLNFTGTNQSFDIKNNGNSVLFINSSGNIGINGTGNSAVDTNNGIPKLQVNTSTALAGEFPLAARFTSGVDAGDNSGVSVLINSGNDRGLMISAGREVGNVAKVTLNVVDNNGDEIDTITMKQSSANSTETNVGIGTSTPNAKLDVQGTQGQLFSVTDDLSGDIFSVADISGVPIMNVNSDGTSYFDGDVGIGINNPSYKLDVWGNGIALGSAAFAKYDSSNDLFLVGDWDGAGADMAIYDGNSDEVIRVTHGNVGIGTTSPSAPLDVFGVRAGRDWAINNRAVIRLDSNGASEPSDILFGHTAAANQTSWTGVYWSLSSRGSSDAGKFHFYRGNGHDSPYNSEAVIMTFKPDLNVGIGTTNPGQKLTVQGSSTAAAGRFTAGGNTNTLELFGSSTTGQSSGLLVNAGTNTADYAARFRNAAGSVIMNIRGDGDVGIGVTSPSAKLHVNIPGSGTVIKATGIGATIEIASATAGNATLYQKPNVTGDQEAEFRMTGGSAYGWSWKDDNATVTSRITYMKLSQGNSSLSVKGDVIAYGAPSDKRYKENIKPIESALDKAVKLQGVTFDWKESDSILDIKEDIGFIAQDVQKVVPELVRENKDGKLSLRYQGITPILLEAIKELKAEIDLLKSKPCNCNNCNCNI